MERQRGGNSERGGNREREREAEIERERATHVGGRERVKER